MSGRTKTVRTIGEKTQNPFLEWKTSKKLENEIIIVAQSGLITKSDEMDEKKRKMEKRPYAGRSLGDFGNPLFPVTRARPPGPKNLGRTSVVSPRVKDVVRGVSGTCSRCTRDVCKQHGDTW